MGLLVLPILGISRLGQITERLSNETGIAKLLGLPRFFNQSTGHDYLNQFTKWHVKQLDNINHQLLLRHGSCTSQPIVIVDIDAQTHTLESRKREKAVVGFNRRLDLTLIPKVLSNQDKNRKKRGKPCYQWNVAFVCQEAVAQLRACEAIKSLAILTAELYCLSC